MPRFAHMSDIHIGAFRQPELRSLLLDAFGQAIDRCIEEGVSFIIMAGDIFDSNIPDLASVRSAAAIMKKAVDAGVRLYAIYGSHDFSPNYSSVVDVLDGAGVFTKAEDMKVVGSKATLSFVKDPSGPKICGISGKKLSIDRDSYAMLDRESLESERGFKIFVFHGAIDELRPPTLEKMGAMPASLLPAGFDYYAGGHVHSHTLKSLPGRPNIAFPGPLFATDYTELLQLAHGGTRGFYIVDYNDAVSKVEFVPVTVCDVVDVQYSAQGKTSAQASKELMALASEAKVEGKVALLTVEGELIEGKTSDIDFLAVRKRLLGSRPILALSSYSHLTSREQIKKPSASRPPGETERELFSREMTRMNLADSRLRGSDGISLALELLRVLKSERKENESKAEYEDRAAIAGLEAMGLLETIEDAT